MKKLKDIDPSLSMNLVYNGEDNVKLTELEVKNWRSLHV
jgi:hypothetical protein